VLLVEAELFLLSPDVSAPSTLVLGNLKLTVTGSGRFLLVFLAPKMRMVAVARDLS
jgi:hypothetical protein